jgi:hypothetical protein
MTTKKEPETRRTAPLRTPSDISPEAVKDISGALNALLADVFALYRICAENPVLQGGDAERGQRSCA